MVILLYGSDTYRSKQKLKEIIEGYKKAHKKSLSLFFFEGKNLEFENFKDTISQASMFGEKKLLVVKNVFANESFKEKFLENYKNFFEEKSGNKTKFSSNRRAVPESKNQVGIKDIVLFYEENKVLKKDRFFNFLKTKAKTQEFDFLKGEELKNWAKKEFLKSKIKINQKALVRLIESTGSDLWLLSSEIKKLVSFKKGKEVILEDVELMTKPKIETAIFKTVDAISQKDKKKALLLIHQHLEKGDHPLYLLSMISFQFKNILVIKDLLEKNKPYYSILKTTDLHPFVVKKSFQQSNKFTLGELKKIYRKIFQADLNIKTGKIDPEAALDLLITEI